MVRIQFLVFLSLLVGCVSVDASSQSKINLNMAKPFLGAGYVAGAYTWLQNVRNIHTNPASGTVAATSSTVSSSATTIPAGTMSTAQKAAAGFVGTIFVVGLANSIRNKIGQAAAVVADGVEPLQQEVVNPQPVVPVVQDAQAIPDDVEVIFESELRRPVNPQPAVQQEVTPAPSCPVCLDGEATVMRDGRGRFIKPFTCQHSICHHCFEQLHPTYQRDEHGRIVFNAQGRMVEVTLCPLCRAQERP
ncbi:hypothetical protein KBD08_03600 [Candidatus Babeliales bacterium]|nr:hypothetical protein [Candidatus Babeliales bacterium]